jgi:hypothetical protein
MAIHQLVSWLDVYDKLIILETQLRDLRQLVLALKPEEVKIESKHPVQLEGIWAGSDVTEEDITAARRSMFPLLLSRP